jgi:lipid-A-disaccharide synthase
MSFGVKPVTKFFRFWKSGLTDEFVQPLTDESFTINGIMMRKQKEVLIVAGESSADRYGAALVKRLNAMHGGGNIRFTGAGGDAMRAAGVELLAHVRDLGHIGPREAVTGLLTYYRVFRQLMDYAETKRPDVAVLLDFPDFNLRLAKKLNRIKVKTVYYISPQLWAWRGGRVNIIKKYVDKMLVILPFEESYYRDRGVAAEFVGHPLLEDFHTPENRAELLMSEGLNPEIETLAILPGSRRKEINYILPVMLRAAKLLGENRQFLISAAPTIDREIIEAIMRAEPASFHGRERFRVSTRNAREILASSDFAFVKSGTSSLEAALTGVPFLVAYKISALSWRIGSLLIRTPSKCLPNLLAGKRIVPELFQDEATPEALAGAAREYLENPEKCAAMRAELGKIRGRLGERRASDAVAAAVSDFLFLEKI